MFILLRDKIGWGASAKLRKQKGRWETQGQKPRLVFYKRFSLYLDGRYCRDWGRPCWCLTRKAAFHTGLASAQLADQPGCCSWTLV